MTLRIAVDLITHEITNFNEIQDPTRKKTKPRQLIFVDSAGDESIQNI